MKQITKLCAIIALGFGSFAFTASTSADQYSTADLKQQIEQARQKLDEAARDLADLNRELYTRNTFDPGGKPLLGVLVGEPARQGGLKVAGVSPGSGAAQAGLRAGDRLLAINGEALQGADPFSQLEQVLADVSAGDIVEVEYARGADTYTTEIETQGRGLYLRRIAGEPHIYHDFDFDFEPELEQLIGGALAMAKPFIHLGERFGDMSSEMVMMAGGLQLADAGPDLAAYFDRDDGVLVIKAPDAGPLKAGDIIMQVGTRKIHSAMQAYRLIMDSRPGVEVEIVRQGKTSRLTLENYSPEFSALRPWFPSVDPRAI